MANESFEVPAIAREIGKKKRSNRTARLKQCKLDARREQWLSQVKKGSEEKAFPISPRSPLQCSPQSKTKKKKQLSPNTPSSYPEEPTNQENNDPESPTCTNCKSEEATNNSSIGSYSRSVSDAEEDYDWETIADALSTSPNRSREHSPMSMESFTETNTRQEQHGRTVSRARGPNDEFRPQSVPNLRHFNAPLRSLCPVCYEELDLTDSSFLPCECGFRICLFCHKRILEADDARCPGCRKQYMTLADGEEIGVVTRLGGRPLVYRFARSCSLRT